MPSLPSHALEAENQELRAEIQQLRAAQADYALQQTKAELYKQSQAQFHTVFSQSPVGNKIIGPDLIIRQANAAIATLLGLESPLELIGHAILEFAHPDYLADWARLQRALWAHHTPSFVVETCLIRTDGTVLWCRVTSILFPDDGGELGYTTLEDISDRKHLEAQVQQRTQELHSANSQLIMFNGELQAANEELLEANAELGKLNVELNTFVYAASHALRSPISNLEGLVHALVRELPAESQQKKLVHPILKMMGESMSRFGHTLDRLADFGTAHTSQGVGHDCIDLALVLEEVRQEVAPLLAATQGQLLVDLAGNATFWFAAKHVYSVLLNLISNALKYRHPDRAPVVQVRSYRELGRQVVTVQDNGLGLSAAQQAQLFRLFKRLHTHVGGTGVGLYLVKKILDNTGGSIQVASELGQGSTFTVVFPVVFPA